MKKKIVATFLCILLLVGLFPARASALVYGDYEYEYVSGGVAITGYNGTGTNITIPNQINGMDVVEIGVEAFSHGIGGVVRNVVLPENLIKISDHAFDGNHQLQTVTFNQKLEWIGENAFYNCSNLVSVPAVPSLQHIGRSAFCGCVKLPAFYGFDGLQYIGEYAFFECVGIKTVEIPKGVLNIEMLTFYNCISIEEITFYDTLESIVANAFTGVSDDVKVTYHGSRKSWAYAAPPSLKQRWTNITFDETCDHYYEVGYYDEPTCSQEGWKIEHCIYCYTKRETILPKNDNHSYSLYYSIMPECTTEGYGYEYCSRCGDIGEQNIVIPKNGHEFSEIVKYVAPTITKSGKWVYGCAWCNATTTVKIDPTGKKLSKAKILVSNKTYTGKAIKPTVTVKYSGKKLKKGTDYTVSYKNNKKIGTATAIIKGKGKYIGTRTVTFKITPKKTFIKKLSSGKKKIKVKWGNVTNSSGYQIVVATNKGFSKNKKEIYVKSKSSDSKTITKLKAKKTYYVRFRAYKTVKVKKIYGPYTKTVKVKTK